MSTKERFIGNDTAVENSKSYGQGNRFVIMVIMVIAALQSQSGN
jgi:hypothetical protein